MPPPVPGLSITHSWMCPPSISPSWTHTHLNLSMLLPKTLALNDQTSTSMPPTHMAVFCSVWFGATTCHDVPYPPVNPFPLLYRSIIPSLITHTFINHYCIHFYILITIYVLYYGKNVMYEWNRHCRCLCEYTCRCWMSGRCLRARRCCRVHAHALLSPCACACVVVTVCVRMHCCHCVRAHALSLCVCVCALSFSV
jgi:hypothetical protein